MNPNLENYPDSDRSVALPEVWPLSCCGRHGVGPRPRLCRRSRHSSVDSVRYIHMIGLSKCGCRHKKSTGRDSREFSAKCCSELNARLAC